MGNPHIEGTYEESGMVAQETATVDHRRAYAIKAFTIFVITPLLFWFGIFYLIKYLLGLLG